MWIKESLESCCFSQHTANFMINHSHNELVDVSIMKDDKSGKIEKYRHVCSSLKQQFCQFIAYLWIKFNGHYSLRIEEFCRWLRKPRNYFKVFLQIPPNFKIQILDVIVESHVNGASSTKLKSGEFFPSILRNSCAYPSGPEWFLVTKGLYLSSLWFQPLISRNKEHNIFAWRWLICLLFLGWNRHNSLTGCRYQEGGTNEIQKGIQPSKQLAMKRNHFPRKHLLRCSERAFWKWKISKRLCLTICYSRKSQRVNRTLSKTDNRTR